MKTGARLFGFSVAKVAIAFLLTSSAKAEPPLEAWIVVQPWYETLADPMPPGVSLRFSIDPSDEPGWDVVEFREVHRPGSGFDPDVSPRVATFRVSLDRKRIEWLTDLTGEWTDLARFYESRGITPASTASVESTPKNELSANLDDDDAMETIRWVSIDSTKSDSFYQLLVIDDDGKTLWSGPSSPTTDNAYVFFESDIGISLPQLLYDIDGDGLVELLGPEPQSDVSATFFRKMTWKNGAFLVLSSQPLMMETPGSNRFTWLEGDHSFGIWVSRFSQVTAEGLVAAEVTRYTEDGLFESGVALLRFDRKGAQVEKWTTPLGAPSGEAGEPLSNSSEMASSASPASVEGTFSARFTIALQYSPAARKKLVDSGEKLIISLIIDQYGPEYMEKEAIASAELTVKPGDSNDAIVVNGIPFSNPAYQVDPKKRYRLSVSMFSARAVLPDNVIDGYSITDDVTWDALQLNGQTLSYVCKLIGENYEPTTPAIGAGGDASVYDPFAGVTPNSLKD